ncbi:hypothetical protein [Rodentibacter myodis]|uniref:Lipoprotein n=1 Tax=Rodentibacter myodis TaxID=1907939 RepID=A0A1V3JSP0_9PAST|nr:hypothetical protein [Rodentibacter myodis]OOF59667.1 hypothetical protein BKL49_02420 [Rodentibacter myodis]
MKKLLICLPALFLVACSSPQVQQDSGVYDMKAVQEYRAKVLSGNTVSAAQKERTAKEIDEPMQMNVSDSRPKTHYQRTPIAIVPSIGLGYYHGYHHHHHHW